MRPRDWDRWTWLIAIGAVVLVVYVAASLYGTHLQPMPPGADGGIPSTERWTPNARTLPRVQLSSAQGSGRAGAPAKLTLPSTRECAFG